MLLRHTYSFDDKLRKMRYIMSFADSLCDLLFAVQNFTR